jgi:MinD-like ATPase involved in chromosome partitioning or flagellar assembly
VTALLATLLARLRPGSVTAVDTDTASTGLGLSLAPGRRVHAADLLDALAGGSAAAALRDQLVATQHGLLLLPAPLPAGSSPPLDEPFHAALFAQLSRSSQLVLADCGVGALPGGRAAVASADLGVVVCRAADMNSPRLEQCLAASRASCAAVVAVVNRASRSRTGRRRAEVQGADHTVWLAEETSAAARLRAAAFSWETAPRSWQAELRALAAALLLDRAG